MQPLPMRYSKLMHRAVSALLEHDQNARSSAKRFLDWYTSARDKIREAELALRGGVGEGADVDGRRYKRGLNEIYWRAKVASESFVEMIVHDGAPDWPGVSGRSVR